MRAAIFNNFGFVQFLCKVTGTEIDAMFMDIPLQSDVGRPVMVLQL